MTKNDRKAESTAAAKPRLRLWIDIADGAFGPGCVNLLAQIAQSGSMSVAAERCGMSYSKAYTLIGHVEKETGCKLLERQTGGAAGGRSELTETARELVARYTASVGALEARLVEGFAENFGDFTVLDVRDKPPKE